MTDRATFTIGQTASLTRAISEDDIRAFAVLSGDSNPVHVDEDYAQASYFKGRIAHGAFVGALISALLGTTLPGPGAIYLAQSMRFVAPVRPDDVVTVTATVTEWDGDRGRIALSTAVVNQRGEPVASGEAKLVIASYLAERQAKTASNVSG